MEGLRHVTDLPVSVLQTVAKRLRRYIECERREEGFDLSPQSSYSGRFKVRTIGGIGSFYYNCIQDCYLQRYLANPLIRHRLLKMGATLESTILEMENRRKRFAIDGRPRTAKVGISRKKEISYYKFCETNFLIEITAGIILENLPTSRSPTKKQQEKTIPNDTLEKLIDDVVAGLQSDETGSYRDTRTALDFSGISDISSPGHSNSPFSTPASQSQQNPLIAVTVTPPINTPSPSKTTSRKGSADTFTQTSPKRCSVSTQTSLVANEETQTDKSTTLIKRSATVV